MSRLALVVMVIALLVGAYLRFEDLSALEMSADEGATWAAAHAPTVREVIAVQQTHNAGKLPVHDLILHGWIAAFGDGLVAMIEVWILPEGRLRVFRRAKEEIVFGVGDLRGR